MKEKEGHREGKRERGKWRDVRGEGVLREGKRKKKR